MRVRALSFVAPRRIEIAEREVPDPGPGQVLVKTLYSGISGGTEMLAYRGEVDPSWPLDDSIGALGGTFAYPFGYGYSCVGTTPDGTLVFAFQPHQDVFVAEQQDLLELDGVDARHATLFPLVETALQISLDAGPVVGLDVVVFGLGAVGVLVTRLLERAGASVIAVDPRDDRRALAGELGCRAVAPDEVDQAVADATRGAGVAVAIEASGHPHALAAALPVLAHEGSLVVASWYGTKPVSVLLGADFHRRRLTIRSSQVSTIPAAMSPAWTLERRRRVALALMHELPLKRLATHEFAFERAADAYAAIDRGERGLMHAALSYDRG